MQDLGWSNVNNFNTPWTSSIGPSPNLFSDPTLSGISMFIPMLFGGPNKHIGGVNGMSSYAQLDAAARRAMEVAGMSPGRQHDERKVGETVAGLMRLLGMEDNKQNRDIADQIGQLSSMVPVQMLEEYIPGISKAVYGNRGSSLHGLQIMNQTDMYATDPSGNYVLNADYARARGDYLTQNMFDDPSGRIGLSAERQAETYQTLRQAGLIRGTSSAQDILKDRTGLKQAIAESGITSDQFEAGTGQRQAFEKVVNDIELTGQDFEELTTLLTDTFAGSQIRGKFDASLIKRDMEKWTDSVKGLSEVLGRHGEKASVPELMKLLSALGGSASAVGAEGIGTLGKQVAALGRASGTSVQSTIDTALTSQAMARMYGLSPSIQGNITTSALGYKAAAISDGRSQGQGIQSAEAQTETVQRALASTASSSLAAGVSHFLEMEELGQISETDLTAWENGTDEQKRVAHILRSVSNVSKNRGTYDGIFTMEEYAMAAAEFMTDTGSAVNSRDVLTSMGNRNRQSNILAKHQDAQEGLLAQKVISDFDRFADSFGSHLATAGAGTAVSTRRENESASGIDSRTKDVEAFREFNKTLSNDSEFLYTLAGLSDGERDIATGERYLETRYGKDWHNGLSEKERQFTAYSAGAGFWNVSEEANKAIADGTAGATAMDTRITYNADRFRRMTLHRRNAEVDARLDQAIGKSGTDSVAANLIDAVTNATGDEGILGILQASLGIIDLPGVGAGIDKFSTQEFKNTMKKSILGATKTDMIQALQEHSVEDIYDSHMKTVEDAGTELLKANAGLYKEDSGGIVHEVVTGASTAVELRNKLKTLDEVIHDPSLSDETKAKAEETYSRFLQKMETVGKTTGELISQQGLKSKPVRPDLVKSHLEKIATGDFSREDVEKLANLRRTQPEVFKRLYEHLDEEKRQNIDEINAASEVVQDNVKEIRDIEAGVWIDGEKTKATLFSGLKSFSDTDRFLKDYDAFAAGDGEDKEFKYRSTDEEGKPVTRVMKLSEFRDGNFREQESKLRDLHNRTKSSVTTSVEKAKEILETGVLEDKTVFAVPGVAPHKQITSEPANTPALVPPDSDKTTPLDGISETVSAVAADTTIDSGITPTEKAQLKTTTPVKADYDASASPINTLFTDDKQNPQKTKTTESILGGFNVNTDTLNRSLSNYEGFCEKFPPMHEQATTGTSGRGTVAESTNVNSMDVDADNVDVSANTIVIQAGNVVLDNSSNSSAAQVQRPSATPVYGSRAFSIANV